MHGGLGVALSLNCLEHIKYKTCACLSFENLQHWGDSEELALPTLGGQSGDALQMMMWDGCNTSSIPKRKKKAQMKLSAS